MKPRSWLLFTVTTLSSFIIYVQTLAPTITWQNDGADSGDLATAVAVGGVPHPPGYPTYLLAGALFKLLPVGDVAYRLNLLSAASAALTAGLVALIIHGGLAEAAGGRATPASSNPRSEIGGYSCAMTAALVLAFSNIFWAQAVIGEVYALHLCLAALLLYLALKIRPHNQAWLTPGLFGLLGLGLGVHLSLLFLVPALGGLLRIKWRARLAAGSLLAFGAGLAVYGLLPLRAAAWPPVNWGAATTWPDFLWLVSASLYRPYLFNIPASFIPGRLAFQLGLLAVSFGGIGLPLGLLGLAGLARHRPGLGYGSLASFFLFSGYAIGYDTSDSYIYLLPACLIFSLWFGWGLYEGVAALRRKFKIGQGQGAWLLSGGLLLLPLASLLVNMPARNISRDWEALRYARHSLAVVAPEAVIITTADDQTFALWYGRYGLAWREDVAIVNRNLLPYPWYRRTLGRHHAGLILTGEGNEPLTTLPAFIEANEAVVPLYVTGRQVPLPPGYKLESVPPLWRVIAHRRNE